MRVFAAFLLCLLALLPQSGAAGAWLREEGRTFTSVTFNANYFRDIANGTYIEHGLRKDLTLGADIGFATSRYGVQGGYATVFLRRPLGDPDGASRWAYELGIGAGWVGDLVLPHVKTGLSYGRGITLGGKSGWLAIDGSVTWDLTYAQHLSKLDTTVGLNFTDQVSGMLQIYLAHVNGQTFSTVAPSVLYQPKGAKYRLQVGFEAPTHAPDDTALKLGIWRSF